jgi:hypothetical protein
MWAYENGYRYFIAGLPFSYISVPILGAKMLRLVTGLRNF